MTALLWWLMLVGVWPFADPGHTDLSSTLVWIDLMIHSTAAGILLNREIDRRARKRASSNFGGTERPCTMYTARKWSPLADRPEDARCVNCGVDHGGSDTT